MGMNILRLLTDTANQLSKMISTANNPLQILENLKDF